MEYPGKDYGLKILDPSDGTEVFNGKYPIFGSDISNSVPQIITHKVTVTNSSGKFNEPTTPTIPWVNDGNWRYMQYAQMDELLVAKVPHGQKKAPLFMTAGSASIRHTMRLRYWHRDQSGSMDYNTVYLPSQPSGGYHQYVIEPRLGGVGSPLPDGQGIYGGGSFTFNNVGPLGTIGWAADFSNFFVMADDEFIYVYASIDQSIQYQRLRDTQYNFGWDRYLKGWSDLSGSTFDFTFYILPYDKNEDIYIR